MGLVIDGGQKKYEVQLSLEILSKRREVLKGVGLIFNAVEYASYGSSTITIKGKTTHAF